MLSLLGPAGRLCDSFSRRELLSVGGLSLLGLGLPQVLRREAHAAEETGSKRARGVNGCGQAESVLLVYLQGSPSHIDLWDPKPTAPAEIRGEFAPISTRAPGMFLGEVLPKLAEQADKFTLVRSIGVKPKGLPNHGSAIYMLMTGHDSSNFSPTGLAVPPSREDLPAVGAIAARYRPADSGRLSYATLCAPVREGREVGIGQSAGLLGGGFDPFMMYDVPTHPLRLEALTLPAGVSPGRLQARMDLRAAILAGARGSSSVAPLLGQPPVRPEVTRSTAFDAYYERALALIQSQQTIRAFRLDEESAPTRARYGMTRFGQSCLLARRMIEAGTRFVQVTWPAGSDTEPAPGPDGSWDTHRNNFPTLKNDRCPVFDHTMSALIEDLAQRGLLDRTLVVAVGEFGRSPRIGAATTNNVGPGGRDHWPDCYSFLIAGGGVRPGQVYGESDRFGAYPKSNPVHPYDLICTVYHALGIDLDTEYFDSLNRPRRLVDHGRPIVGLF